MINYFELKIEKLVLMDSYFVINISLQLFIGENKQTCLIF